MELNKSKQFKQEIKRLDGFAVWVSIDAYRFADAIYASATNRRFFEIKHWKFIKQIKWSGQYWFLS